jgi:hypothetical protein
MPESSEDSELRAMLDAGLFADDEEEKQDHEAEVADAADGDGTAAAVAEDSGYLEDEQLEQQVAKRPRTGTSKGNEDVQGAASEQQQRAKEAICPPHPGWLMDMCIRCGKPKETGSAASGGAAATVGSSVGVGLTKIKHLHHRHALEVSCTVCCCAVQVQLKRMGAS